ncbi:MAG: chromosome segregation protein SMC [Nitrospira sp.]|nr:chromosome segregation protein SMC [Nitrospira sp.]
MYLKSLDMLGFKSFAEAKINFPEGVTAIVGPNGSGKSNVVDAILWVLGEQSTKTLRSEKMEDVIFNGTELRKPLGMAEVSLTIGGLDRASMKLEGGAGLPSQLTDFQELMITRRLYRNGESEYLVNKTACRLKDIRSLLLDTRAGSKGHTVIAQGQIDQILNASPQDRRELIEETAGIVRYKKQKAEALRKLEATQQNLLRVRDIIAEVKKQLNSLERQARQARTYQTLQQEARGLEVELLTREFRALRAGLGEAEAEVAALDVKDASTAADQSRVVAELEQARLQAIATNDVIGHTRDRVSGVEHQQAQALTAAEVARNRGQLFEQQQQQEVGELEELTRAQSELAASLVAIEALLAAMEQELAQRESVFAELDREMARLLEQRAVAVAEEERGRQDILQLAVQVANTEQALVQLGVRMSEVVDREAWLIADQTEAQAQRSAAVIRHEALRLEYGEAGRLVSSLRTQQEVVQGELSRVGDELRVLDQVILRRSEELAAVDSRLQALQGLVREEMGYGRAGSDEATALKSCGGVRDAIAEWLVIPPGLDRAVETFLGERVHGWLVDEPAVAQRAIGFLREKSLGRGTFIPQRVRWEPTGSQSSSWWEAIAGTPGVVGRAVDLIHTGAERAAARDSLFDRVVFVESLDDAVRLWEQQAWSGQQGPILVTRSGEIMDASGVISGGQACEGQGLLERRREVIELERTRTDVTVALEQEKQQRLAFQAVMEELTGQAREVADNLRQTEMQDLSLRKDEETLRQVVSDLDLRLTGIKTDISKGASDRERYEWETSTAEAQLRQWMEEKASREAGLVQVRERVAEIDREGRVFQERVTEARLLSEGQRAKREHEQANQARVRQQQAEAEQRRQSLAAHLEGLGQAIQESREEQTRQETACRELGETVAQLKAELVAMQERQTQELEVCQGLETNVDELRRVMSAVRDARMAIEVRRAELRTQLGTVESTLLGTYQLDLVALAGERQPLAEGQLQEQAEVAGNPLIHTPNEELKAQLQKLRERLDRMGPINLAAIGEHQELEQRYTFLSTQEQDLSTSMASLKEIIQRINRTTKDMFAATFIELQEKFGEVFVKFFPGGRAELQLVEEPPVENGDGSGHQESGIDIVAQPPGKRLKSITMLSGGEKTLTAMALLFASFLIRPTPFCLLDEIDAPLDEENIGRFTDVLRDLAQSAQFLVITHNKRTMGIADSLFGVTMEEPGVSKLVSVRLGDLQPV